MQREADIKIWLLFSFIPKILTSLIKSLKRVSKAENCYGEREYQILHGFAKQPSQTSRRPSIELKRLRFLDRETDRELSAKDFSSKKRT